ncbi:traB domain-containing protein isoform X2 [Megalopta genalis]|uniref:traB domain-containing protein isoform X2 n=1 Tax=Megalopta genalis TaxID=115081 RepID=UPI001442EF68|nr:traB domain-containing protein isoform X2 [Megalopta genalis]
MSSKIKNLVNSNLNVSQDQKNVEDNQYSVVDQKDDHNAEFKFDEQDTNKKLIASESGIPYNLIYESEDESPIMETSMVANEVKIEENVGSRTNSGAQSKSDHKSHDSNKPNQQEYDASIDERLPETVTLLTTPNGGKLYLVGTAHFSVESQNDVSMIIQAVQPHIIVVELCKARAQVMQFSEEVILEYTKNLTYRKHGVCYGLLHMLLLRVVAQITKQLGMAPGGEFRRAFEEAKKLPNCIIHLADRPFNITIQRALRLLTWWQTFKLGWCLINLKSIDISKEYVEVCKQKSLLDNLIHELKEEYPPIEKVFVKERDLYLTHSLQTACMVHLTANEVIPPRVVGIVGIGHTPGIIENWGKVIPSDIPPIMSVPPQPLSSKILLYTVKISLLSAVIYVGYKILPMPSGVTLQSIRSSVDRLLKVIVTK